MLVPIATGWAACASHRRPITAHHSGIGSEGVAELWTQSDGPTPVAASTTQAHIRPGVALVGVIDGVDGQ